MPFQLDNLIPRPLELESREGVFEVSPLIRLEFPPEAAGAVERLRLELNRTLLTPISGSPGNAPRRIVFRRCDDLPPEGYRLEISPTELTVSGDPAGMFYAVQTLQQIILTDIDQVFPRESYLLPCCRIVDAPRFSWRGFMLDSARHFQSKETVLRLIDLLALYKINRFHWHLMDNYGWRILLDRFPELVQYDSANWFNAGFYRPEDIREIVEYAGLRHIKVFPEIEMPSHSSNVFRFHPELACPNDDPYGNHIYEYCIGNPASTEFLREIITEIMAIFHDSPYCHIGGDEARHEIWEACPRCREARRAAGVADMVELEGRFMNGMAGFARSLGYRPMVWAGHGNYAPDVLIQAWHEGEAEIALERGNEVVNAVHDYVYLDYPADDSEDKFDWMPMLPLEKAYRFEPVPEGTPPEKEGLVLGGECCLWTEKVPENMIFGKIFPRLCAFAETVWSRREGRDFKAFLSRTKIHMNSVVIARRTPENERKPRMNISDIAREARVSKTAVSLFMNGKAQTNKIAMETCARIATAIRNNNYRPNVHARAMQKHQRNLVSVLIPDSGERAVWMEILRGLNSVLEPKECRIMLGFYDIARLECGIAPALARREDCGILVTPPRFACKERDMITLSFGDGPERSVTPDFTGAGITAARVLARAGHKHIAVIGCDDGWYSSCREAFVAEAGRLGIALELCGNAQELESRLPEVSAVFYDGDRAMVQSYHSAAKLDMSIPDRLSVIGAGSRECASLQSPPAEVIDFDWNSLGREAALMLMDVSGESEARRLIDAVIVGDGVTAV